MNTFTLESETNYADFQETNKFLVPINYVPNLEMYKSILNSVTNEYKIFLKILD